jgi:carbamoyl-phosphate synthase large subunit
LKHKSGFRLKYSNNLNVLTIRRSAIDYNIPIITNAQLAAAFLTAGCRISLDELELKSWNEYGGW